MFLFADSLETITVGNDLALRGWDQNSQVKIETTLFKDGTQSIKGEANTAVRWKFNGDAGFIGTGYLSIWFRLDYTPTNDRIFIGLISDNLGVLNIILDQNLTVRWTDAVGTTISSNSSFIFNVDQWYHLEIKWAFKDSVAADDCTLTVDGVEISNVDATEDTKFLTKDTIDGFRLFSSGSIGKWRYWDSPIFWDNEAGDTWNASKGKLQIETKVADANGPDNDFTGSDADSVNNYLQVDEFNDLHDGDSTYNQSFVIGDKDSYNLPDIVSGDFGAIRGVQVAMISKKTDTEDVNLTPFFVDGGSDQLGSEHSLTNGTYTSGLHFWDENPDSAVAWVKADITDGNFGVKVT